MSRTILRFADCSFDAAARALARDGACVDLPPIVFDCIAYLVLHRERAVGRDELVAAVWGKSAISDTMLGKAILAARRALGDSAEAQAFIRTIPRFGYHWVGAVREETLDPAEEAAAVSMRSNVSVGRAEQQPTRAHRKRLIGAGITAILVIAIAVPTHRYLTSRSRTAQQAATDNLPAGLSAVLPVEVVAGADDAWLRLGLMDLIANRLRAADMPVMSSDSVVSLLKQNGATTTDLAQALRRANPGTRMIEVSIAKSGRDWILHAQVTQVDSVPRAVDARAGDAVAAARAGADRLLELFGKRAPASQDADGLPLDLLMQRTEAARLSDDLDTARSLLEGAAPALRALPEVRLRRAQIELRAGRFDDARSRLEALLAEVPAEDDPVLRARILVTLCNAQGRLDRQPEAIVSCSEAIALATAHDATEPLAIAYNNRAITHARQRDFAAAEADFARARIAFERNGDMLALVRLDGNEASAAMGRGRPAEALPILERAGRRFDQLGIFSESLIAVTNQIDAQRALLDSASALAASEHGWAILPRVQDRNLQHWFKQQRAEALAANGRLAEAHALLDELIGDIDPAQESATLAMTRASQAALELDSGQTEIASVLADQAVAALQGPEYDQPRAAAALTRIRALRRLGRAPAADATLARLAAWSDATRTPIAMVYSELASAEQAAGAGETAAADAHFERASAAATELNLPYLIKLVAMAYGQALIARKETERAAIVIGRVSRYVETDFDSAVLQTRLYHALGEQEAWRTALARSRGLAGERPIPAEVADPPATPALSASMRAANAFRTAAEQ